MTDGESIRVMAIDPGPKESAFVIIDAQGQTYGVKEKGKKENALILEDIQYWTNSIDGKRTSIIIIEDMEARYSAGDASAAGARVGATTFETCKWMGRFDYAAKLHGAQVAWIKRTQERARLIPSKRNGLPPLPNGAPKHADGQIRAALIQRFARMDKVNGKGTAKNPDFFHGFAGDMWQAFAVGVTWLDDRGGEAWRKSEKKTRKR